MCAGKPTLVTQARILWERIAKAPGSHGMDSRASLSTRLAGIRPKTAMDGKTSLSPSFGQSHAKILRGPGFRISDFESNRIIGQLQFEGAQTIMNSSLTSISGPVKSVHTYLNMLRHFRPSCCFRILILLSTGHSILLNFPTEQLCRPALPPLVRSVCTITRLSIDHMN